VSPTTIGLAPSPWPNSFRDTRPSVFRPTSTTAKSFSIAYDLALDDSAFVEVATAEGLVEEGREIIAGRVQGLYVSHALRVSLS